MQRHRIIRHIPTTCDFKFLDELFNNTLREDPAYAHVCGSIRSMWNNPHSRMYLITADKEEFGNLAEVWSWAIEKIILKENPR